MELVKYVDWLKLEDKTGTRPLLTKAEFAECNKNGTIPKGGITVSDLSIEELKNQDENLEI
jgi:hypothetical protein